jgi:beta-N-acetylhexosaminidase
VVAALNRYQTDQARALRERCALPLVVVSLGSPYLLQEVKEARAFVTTYSYREAAAVAAARFLAGEIPAPGTLPVPVPGLYPVGHTATRDVMLPPPGRKAAWLVR